jgi:predicted transcriptional regulator
VYMSAQQRRYKVTKPGNAHDKDDSTTQRKAVPAADRRGQMSRRVVSKKPEATPPIPDRGRRKYKVTKPGITGPPPSQVPKPTEPPKARPGPGGRRYRVKTPGRTVSEPPMVVKPIESRPVPDRAKAGGRIRPSGAPGRVKSQKPQVEPKRARALGKRKTAGPGAEPKVIRVHKRDGVGARKPRGKIERAPAAISGPKARMIKDDGTASDIESTVMEGLDKGPGTIQILIKRTGLPQSKLLPVLKNLSSQGLVTSKKFKRGRITKYKLTEKGDDHLHPRKFPMTLFGGRRKPSWAKRRKLSRQKRMRRLDYAIATLVIVILVLVIYFMLMVYGIFQLYEQEKDSGDEDEDLIADQIPPGILWENSYDVYENSSVPLEVNLMVFDPGEKPSGINLNYVRVQYGFATTSDQLVPDIKEWTNIVPIVNLPKVDIILDWNWSNYNGYYFYLRCSAEDNNENRASETFIVLIDIIDN